MRFSSQLDHGIMTNMYNGWILLIFTLSKFVYFSVVYHFLKFKSFYWKSLFKPKNGYKINLICQNKACNCKPCTENWAVKGVKTTMAHKFTKVFIKWP